jgi:hypothetical protein
LQRGLCHHRPVAGLDVADDSLAAWMDMNALDADNLLPAFAASGPRCAWRPPTPQPVAGASRSSQARYMN